MRPLTISFGGDHFSRIEKQDTLHWDDFAIGLSTATKSADKAAIGWYAAGSYRDNYRDEDHLVARECLTFDFDHITPEDVGKIEHAYANFEYVLYTTHSHKPKAPRLRMVLPLSRPVTADELRAVSRAVASLVGIELVAPESHKPAQFMFMPSMPEHIKFRFKRNTGPWVDVESMLNGYKDWTDRTQWPCAKADTTYKSDELPVPARDKPGIIGAFNRVYTITQAVEAFDLPYSKVSDTRWTYTKGSRPEGARTYDDDSKMHSENATDPARGQHSAFDLVRLHRFGHLDAAVSADEVDMRERPSFRAMVEFADGLPEVRTENATRGFDCLPSFTDDELAEHLAGARRRASAARSTNNGSGSPGAFGELSPLGDDPLSAGGRVPGERVIRPEGTPESAPAPTLARSLDAVLKTPTKPRWLIKDELERGVIALLAGPRGSYKSFKALNWAMRIALSGEPVYVVSAEGGDFDRRAKAWVMTHCPDAPAWPPLYVVERRLDLNSDAGINQIREDCRALRIKPVLFVLDTFSKLSGGLDENDNTQVKQFIGRLDHGLKRADSGFDATVLLVAHTGHSDKGRARGASALGADTDAEYIVRRHQNGKTTVFVTRERFKSSPELPPLCYEPKVVDLQYADDNGGKVTSLVLSALDGADIPHKDRLNAVQQEAMTIAYQLLDEGSTTYEKIILAIAGSMPPPLEGERDTRKQRAKTRVEVLEKRGYLRRRKDSNVVSKTSATDAMEEAFDDKGGDDE